MYRNVALFVLIALTSSALGGPGREKMEADKKECAESVGIDPASIAGPPKMDNDFIDTPQMHCFGACMMKKMGKMNDDGTMNVERMMHHLPPDMPERDTFVDAVKECAAKKGENDCETAHEIFKCLREKKVPMHPRPPRPQ